MRITAEEKNATRQRILDAALELFGQRGFEATTTRDIALAAGTAVGTLFNYFPTKEAIVEVIAARAMEKAHADVESRLTGDDLEEDLFALVAAELRQLKPIRKFIAPLLQSTLCPLAAGQRLGADGSPGVIHLEAVLAVIREHELGELSPVALQVYWTLYVGVLAFWSADKSPRQEDTLALLDQSLAMFSNWLRSPQVSNV